MGRSFLTTTLMVLAFLFCSQMVAEAGQNSAVTVHIDLDTTTAGIQTTRTAVASEIFDVDVVIKDANNLKTFNLVVSFPEAVLAIQEDGVTKGDLFPDPEISLEDPDGKVFFMKDLSMPGKAQITGIIMSNDDVVTGDGALFRLKFNVLDSTEPANLQFLAEDTQILQDNTGARLEAIDDPVALENANGAAINWPVHSADTDSNYVIGDFELLDNIDQWARGEVGDFELLDKIDLWAAGSYHWDPDEGKFKPGTQT